MLKTVIYDYQAFSLQRFGGISRYFCELAARINGYHEWQARIVAPVHYNLHLRNVAVPKTGYHIRLRLGRLAKAYRAINRSLSPRLMSAFSPALVHRTYYEETARHRGVPMVVTVFDMIHELFADQFSPSDPTSANKRLSVASADHVLCISHSTARDLTRLFGVPPGKISVTHLGYSESFSSPPPAEETPPHIRPYVLYVGHRTGYKNFEAALRAYAASSRLVREFDFLVFGGPSLSPLEHAFAQKLGLRSDALRQLGGNDAELARAYRHARTFVYPSLYEGFGIPPLEAMAAGAVVASANTSSLPEVVGDAAITFDPTDIDQIRNAVESACFDEDRRLRLVASSKERIRQFSWEACAEATMRSYSATLSDEGR